MNVYCRLFKYISSRRFFVVVFISEVGKAYIFLFTLFLDFGGLFRVLGNSRRVNLCSTPIAPYIAVSANTSRRRRPYLERREFPAR